MESLGKTRSNAEAADGSEKSNDFIIFAGLKISIPMCEQLAAASEQEPAAQGSFGDEEILGSCI